MRLYSAFLLVTSLAVADAVDCDRSKLSITGGQYDYIGKKLTCKDLGYVIEIENKLLDSAKCFSTPWSYPGGSLIVTGKEQFVAKCVAKACHQLLIDGFDSTTMTYASNVLSCSTSGHILKYKDGSPKESSALTCNPTGKWSKAGGGDTGVANDAKLEVTSCVAPPPVPCAQAWLTLQNGAQYAPGTPVTVTCPSGQLSLGGVSYPKLECTPAIGWTDGVAPTPLKTASEAFTVDCLTPSGCTHTASPDLDTSVPGTIRCNQGTNFMRKLRVGSNDYSSLSCQTGQQWKDEQGADVAPSDTQLAVACVKYCESISVSAAPDAVEVAVANGELSAKCPATTYSLSYGDAPGTTAKDPVLKCSLVGEWKDGTNEIAKGDAPLKLECKKVCASIKHVDAGVEKAGLTPDAKELPSGVFKCSDPKKGIKLADKFVHSHLHCDSEHGWHGFDAKDSPMEKLAAPSEEVTISCALIECPLGSHSTCVAFTKSDLATKGEYECDQVDSTKPYKPSEITDDPNKLKCEDLQNIFDTETRTFYNKSVATCSDDKKWRIFDEEKKENVEINGEKLVCVRKRCNTCADLDQSSTQPEEQFVPEPGAFDTCATVTCPDDLWMVKPQKTDPQGQQYAGKVTCSSDAVTQGKWLIDGETVIEAASCIPTGQRATVSCKASAPLTTACPPAMSDCVAIDLNDDAPTECQGGKNMFYKQKGAPHFEEGWKIACDKTKGIWTITKETDDVLRRGGTIFCADQNPAPAPTPPACSICPNSTDILRKCAACSQKGTDLQFENDKTNETCIVTAYGNGNIETDLGTMSKIFCKKKEKIWRTADGKEVGKFAAHDGSKKDDGPGNTLAIVGGIIGVILLLIVVFVVIFKVFVSKKKPVDRDEEAKRKMLEETKKRRKQKAGDNDEILDDVEVEAPNEIKL